MVGGDVLEGNLLANCVREVRQSLNRVTAYPLLISMRVLQSGDHGTITMI